MEFRFPLKLSENHILCVTSVLAALLLFGSEACYAQQASTREKPNFLFILADDLGYADLSCMGSNYYETPHIDAIADKGVVFTHGYAGCQVCSPSRATIMTGQFAARHGITDWIGAKTGEAWREKNRKSQLLPPDYHYAISKDAVTLPEALKAAGYTTFFAGKWHLGDKGNYPEDHGFDINKGGWDKGSPAGGFFAPFKNPTLEDHEPGENLTMRLAKETARFMAETKDKPFLAYLSFYAVHAPIQATKEKWAKYRDKADSLGIAEQGFEDGDLLPMRMHQDNPVYAGLIEAMDDAVGLVLHTLKETGLDKNTIVIFTSDNGGVTSGDHYATSNSPLKGGKGYQWEGGIRVPYMIHVPWMDHHGQRNNTPVAGSDFYPTILELAGLPLPSNSYIDGKGIVPLLEGKSMAERPLFWHYPHYGNQGGRPVSTIRQGDWKLIHYWEDGHDELYNLAQDIHEDADLASTLPDKTHELTESLMNWLQETGAKFPMPDPLYDEAAEKAFIAENKVRLAKTLDSQRTAMLNNDWSPNEDWWGSIPPRKTKFNSGWLFQLGENEKGVDIEYDDANWAEVKIPHDWSIEGEIKQDNPSGKQGGFYPGGIGYYRKTFSYQNAWQDKQVLVTFDGVMSNSEVWVNGQSLGKRPNGYVGFTYDLTPHLQPGENLLVVRADNSAQPNSRWYTGCGIYRNVWLIVKNKIAVAENGTFVFANDVNSDLAELEVETIVENTTLNDEKIQIKLEIYNPSGEKFAEEVVEQKLGKQDSKTVRRKIEVKNPTLWSIDSPNLYVLVTKIISGSQVLDTYKTAFGIRDIRFEIKTGFWLNGENIKIKGVNNHHDGGPVGAAVPDDVLHRRLQILKEMGCNAIRTAHNPFSPEFYSMCDSMGFLVMDEVFDEWIASWPWVKYQNQGKVKHGYHKHFEAWAQKDLEDIIQRDRNHPSIFMWSVGNEIPDQCYAEGPVRLTPLLETVHALDPTRPVTAGCCFMHLANESGFSSLLDVAGYNGGGGSVFYEKDKEIYPERKFIATEIPHSFQTRGVYQTQTVMRSPQQGISVPALTAEEVFPEYSSKFYNSSYDNSSVRISARDSWRRTDSLPYVAGEFRWTGYDYLGEAIKGWPSRFFNFGIIDLCGFPKDHYYFYQSQWTEELMVHILPHWTWPGKEGKTIPVWTYSNAEEVELFLNDKSLGVKSNKGQMNLSWEVPYSPGTLKAVAKTKGKVVSEKIVKTAGPPASIELIVDKKTIKADGESCVHVEVNVLDAAGNFVPNASNLIHFDITGPAQNIGVENGDPLDLASTKIKERKAFNGKALMILQSGQEVGLVEVKASSQGLNATVISFEVVAQRLDKQ